MNFEILNKYIENVRREYRTGVAREHSYRPALKELFESLEPGTIAINDPARQAVGAPDFQVENAVDHQLRQGQLLSSPPLAFIEHKDLTESLDKPEHQEQLKRYLRLGNVLHTNGLVFRFYIKDEKPIEITLAELTPDKKILIDSAQYNSLALAYHNLIETKALTIRTPLRLATLMAERAQAIRDIIEAALKGDLDNNKDTELTNQFKVFRAQLVHDLDEHSFADLYAQTLAYGLFAARYNDKTLGNFTLAEAAKIMPPTNRFLRKFFLEIAGYERESRINWVLDNLVEVFNRVNVKELMRGAGEEWAKHHDPIIHFYETFLSLYDPKLRKKMGVYYTPQPIVKYIVRSVDEILKEEFGIEAGLSDDSKIDREVKGQPMSSADKKRGYSLGKKPVHKVQVLDPALGTGTFLNEVIKSIAAQVKPRLGSGWSKYVEDNLLPRLYGFELMMAPYAMANLRLNLTLAETGYKILRPNARLQVLLTNSLEAPNENELNQIPFAGFQQVLATEAQEADIVKANHNVMVVMGNPPYSVSSNNKSDFIQDLIKTYKQDLHEKKINLDDDYIKFIRFAEDMIAKNGEGIVAMITNNSYLDGVTHRQMRKHLLETFDKIYVLDLHGNSKKKEAPPNGGKDENVFDIQQGVSIIYMVKAKSRSSSLGEVYHTELWGKRIDKLTKLQGDVVFEKVCPVEPYYFFVPKNNESIAEYRNGIALNELFNIKSSGFRSGADHAQICWSKKQIKNMVQDLTGLPEQDFRLKYDLKDGRNHYYDGMKNDVGDQLDESRVVEILYRPFDIRYTYYSMNSSGFAARPRNQTMRNFLNNPANIGIVFTRMNRQFSTNYFFLTSHITDEHILDNGLDSNVIAPLYICHDDGTKTANFNAKVLKEFTDKLNSEYQPEDILDYIYAVLNTPAYRQKYREFLKIDFPRVPAPDNDKQFKNLVNIGAQLRQVHLLKDPELDKQVFTPTEDGNWKVQKISFEATSGGNGNVYVNESQYFANVPKEAFDFYIGGYQPAQKWLKDRKGRELSHQDLIHYQKIIASLEKTVELQANLDQTWKK